MNPEEQLETIRAKWADETYQPGTQESGNYIRQDDALEMISILEKNNIPFSGFEVFRLFPDGGVQPDGSASKEYAAGAMPDGKTPYAHAAEHIERLKLSGETLYYQIYYNSAERLADSIRRGLIKPPSKGLA